jgi:hypothetical protein
LDNLFNEYEQLVRITDSFVYHLYPCYANINEQEKLEKLNRFIRSDEDKGRKETLSVTDDDFVYQRLPYLFAWLEGKIRKKIQIHILS